MSFFFTWMRLSSMKQLDWYRNSSYQSKDIAHVQKTITQRIADKVRGTDQSLCGYEYQEGNINIMVHLMTVLPLQYRY